MSEKLEEYEFKQSHFDVLLKICMFSLENDFKLNNYLNSLFEKDFNSLEKLAKIHRILPILYNLCLKGNIKLPKKELSIKNSFHTEVVNSLKKTKELLNLNELLVKNGIQPIFYKGSVLSYQLFNGLGKRSFNDIDIIIPKKDLKNVEKILVENNYKLRKEFTSTSNKSKFLSKRNEIGFLLKKNNQTISIDLHWSLVSPLSAIDFDSERLYEEDMVTDFNLNGVDVKTFKIEFLPILFSIHHGGNDLWNKLKHFYDWAMLMKKYRSQIDWRKVQKMSQRYDIENLLLISLIMLEKLFQIPLPQELSIPSNNRKLQRIANQRLLKLKQYKGEPLDKWYYKIWFRLMTTNKLTTKLTIIKRCIMIALLKVNLKSYESLQH